MSYSKTVTNAFAVTIKKNTDLFNMTLLLTRPKTVLLLSYSHVNP